MASEYTPNYNLDLYASADKPNLRDQYNAAMGKIDTQMQANADGITNANASIGTLQTQMKQVQDDASALESTVGALESTVETHGTQITGVQKTANDALSLAQANEADIASVEAELTPLKSRVEGIEDTVDSHTSMINGITGEVNDLNELTANLQSGKAPTNHASANSTYGISTESMFGHVKLTDAPTNTGGGVAASPKCIAEWFKTRDVELTTPGQGSFNNDFLHKVVINDMQKTLQFIFRLMLPGDSTNQGYVRICTCAQLGIPVPAAKREILSGVSCFQSSPAVQQINGLIVQTNGDVVVGGWNMVNQSRVNWDEISSLQFIVNYGEW